MSRKAKARTGTPLALKAAHCGPAPNQRQAPDQRWQRTVRFNWDKGGSKGGRK